MCECCVNIYERSSFLSHEKLLNTLMIRDGNCDQNQSERIIARCHRKSSQSFIARTECFHLTIIFFSLELTLLQEKAYIYKARDSHSDYLYIDIFKEHIRR